MYALIQDRHGQELTRYALTGDDALDCDIYADRFARDFGVSLEGEQPGASIPDGCEDISVTLTDEPGAARAWSSRNYMMTTE